MSCLPPHTFNPFLLTIHFIRVLQYLHLVLPPYPPSLPPLPSPPSTTSIRSFSVQNAPPTAFSYLLPTPSPLLHSFPPTHLPPPIPPPYQISPCPAPRSGEPMGGAGIRRIFPCINNSVLCRTSSSSPIWIPCRLSCAFILGPSCSYSFFFAYFRSGCTGPRSWKGTKIHGLGVPRARRMC